MPVMPLKLPEKHPLELHHPGVGEQQRRVICGDQRPARADGVLVSLEILEKRGANV
jgi:hypothetical protein